MLYFPSINLLYLKPTKTASTSIQFAFGEVELNRPILSVDEVRSFLVIKDLSLYPSHYPWSELSNQLKQSLQTAKKVVSVRHPYDRVKSEFRYQRRGIDGRRSYYHHINDINGAIQSGSFWSMMHSSRHDQPLSSYKVDDGDCYVIKYESLEQNWSDLQSEVSFTLPSLKKIRPRYSAWEPVSGSDLILTDESKEIIYNKYKSDFNLFGYTP